LPVNQLNKLSGDRHAGLGSIHITTLLASKAAMDSMVFVVYVSVCLST